MPTMTHTSHIIIATILAASTLSCNRADSDIDSAVERTLQLAGDNRTELQHVLDHYSDNPEKEAAAKFLIANMPGHYSYDNDEAMRLYWHTTDSLLDAMDGRPDKEICDSINAAAARIDFSNVKQVEDAEIITARFLIDNIDKAFDQWHNGHWARHLNFDQFCEYLLPYKAYEMQPLEEWRSIFDYVNDRHLSHIYECDMLAYSPYFAADFMHRYIQAKYHPSITSYGLDVPVSHPRIAVRLPFGDCSQYSDIGAAAYRSVGIPVMTDFTPVKGNENVGHSWNVLLNPNGENIVFNAMTDSPGRRHNADWQLAKAYRMTYAINREIERLNAEGGYIPGMFRNTHLRDVTAEHTDAADVTVIAPEPECRYIYLAASQADQWVPVAFARLKGGKAQFADMGRNCVYQAIWFTRKGEIQYYGYPFYIDLNGETSTFAPDTCDTRRVSLNRKHPVREYVHHTARKTEGGIFEAADNADFNHSATISVIHNAISGYNIVSIADSIGARRYWRYRGIAPDSRSNIAEIAFFDRDTGKEITGRIIGNGIEGDSGLKAFDKDMLTYFESTCCSDGWIGMDFGRPVAIGSIRYCPRGDGNNVEPGDTYELLYMTTGGWRSLGQKTADDISLTWDNVPHGALLLLVNRTKGREHRIFSISDDGRQIFH